MQYVAGLHPCKSMLPTHVQFAVRPPRPFPEGPLHRQSVLRHCQGGCPWLGGAVLSQGETWYLLLLNFMTFLLALSSSLQRSLETADLLSGILTGPPSSLSPANLLRHALHPIATTDKDAVAQSWPTALSLSHSTNPPCI